MKSILFILLLSTNAFAGTAKLLWQHNGAAVDGSIVPITGFKFYWSLNGGAFTNVIDYTTPTPLPYKIVNGMSYWAKTFTNAAWIEGSTICFKATAFSSTEESAQSNAVCKTFPMDPTSPVIIDIDKP